jgi:hypothetical protein
MTKIWHAALALLGGVVLLTTGMLLSAQTTASASAGPAVTVTGRVSALPARQALVLIEAEVAAKHSGELEDVVVATSTISGPAFRVPVPDSPLLRRIEAQDRGYVEFIAIVDSGRESATMAMPVAMAPAAGDGNAEARSALRSKIADFGQLTPFTPVPMSMKAVRSYLRQDPGAGPGCFWTPYGRQTHSETTIGEVHVARVKRGPTDEYTYTTTDVTDVSWGISLNPTKDYSEAGTVNLNDSVSASGHHTFSDAKSYVDTLMYFQRYKDNGQVSAVCPDPGNIAYKNPADHAAGNVDPAGAVDPGTRGPRDSPYGGCTHDPYGSFALPANSGWSKDRADATTETINGTAWGFNVSAEAGFTNETLQDFEAGQQARTTYICGNGDLPNVSVIWNTNG